jgi:hypothetical protein
MQIAAAARQPGLRPRVLPRARHPGGLNAPSILHRQRLQNAARTIAETPESLPLVIWQ